MICVYGIVNNNRNCEFIELPGRNAIRIVPRGEIGGVVSEISPGDLEMRENNFWKYHEVLLKLSEYYTVLPVRFGTTLRDTEAVRELLSCNYERFVTAINNLKGKVEIGVKVMRYIKESGEEYCPVQKSELTGKAYIMSRLQQKRKKSIQQNDAGNLGAEINSILNRESERSNPVIRGDKKIILNGAYLVNAGHVDYFKKCVKEIALRYPDLKFLISGPWPPYNFVSIKCS